MFNYTINLINFEKTLQKYEVLMKTKILYLIFVANNATIQSKKEKLSNSYTEVLHQTHLNFYNKRETILTILTKKETSFQLFYCDLHFPGSVRSCLIT